MILVTGATGTIGRELVQDLLARKARFQVMVRSEEAHKALASKRIMAVPGNFDRPITFAKALEGVRKVFLLTTPRPDLLKVEAAFLDACRVQGVAQVVRLSAMGANPSSASALLRGHGQCEAQLEASGLPWTVLRPTIFMQNLAPHMGPSVSRESTLYAPAGEALVPWVDARDVAAAAATVLTSEGHQGLVYELTGPQALTYTGVAALLSALMGRNITYVDVPDGAAHRSMTGMGMSPWLAEGLINLYHLFKANGATALTLGTVERLTGRSPRTLEAYLQEHLGAFMAPRPSEALR